MQVKDAIAKRRSIRDFKSQDVEKEKVNQILEAARLAPSGTNIQPWRFVIVESEEMREELTDTTLNFVGQAPVTIVCCVDKNALQFRKRRTVELYKAGAFAGTELENVDFSNYQGRTMDDEDRKRYLHFNLAIAIENMILQATELGLGSCWVMMFNDQKVTDLLNLDDNLEPVSLVPVGYPDQDPDQRPRLNLEDIVIDKL
ncbi:nitroreductase family protein [Halanaerocella petrolearia]